VQGVFRRNRLPMAGPNAVKIIFADFSLNAVSMVTVNQRLTVLFFITWIVNFWFIFTA